MEDKNKLNNLLLQVRTPPTVGRLRQHGTKRFAKLDIDFVADCGFPIS
jgi:hypothetical protein